MENLYLIHPGKGMSFDILMSEKNTVRVKWSHNPFKDYKQLAFNFYTCGFHMLAEVLRNQRDVIKRDIWFLSGVYLVRHSIELGLKALICRICNKKNEIQTAFMQCGHSVSMLFQKYSDDGKEACLTAEESIWLKKYLISIEEADGKSDVFRFPLEESFLSKYAYKFLSIENIVKNLLQAFELIEKCLEFEDFPDLYSFDNSCVPKFLTLSETGYGCNLWQPNLKMGFGYKIKAYCDVIDFLYEDKSIRKEEKLFPLAFMGRNAVELSLKRLLVCRAENGVQREAVRFKRKSHLLRKELWKNVKPMILEYIGDDEYVKIDDAESLIYQLDSIDKHGDAFRYSTTYSLEYHFDNKVSDIKNTCACCFALANYLEECGEILEESKKCGM